MILSFISGQFPKLCAPWLLPWRLSNFDRSSQATQILSWRHDTEMEMSEATTRLWGHTPSRNWEFFGRNMDKHGSNPAKIGSCSHQKWGIGVILLRPKRSFLIAGIPGMVWARISVSEIRFLHDQKLWSLLGCLNSYNGKHMDKWWLMMVNDG